MNRVLSVSCDATLLNSREHVLSHSGIVVVSALGISNALRSCENGDFDLLLLCHSIPTKDKSEIIRRFRQSCGGSVLAMHKPCEGPVTDADHNFDAGRNPADLVAAVSRILLTYRRRKVASAGHPGPTD